MFSGYFRSVLPDAAPGQTLGSVNAASVFGPWPPLSTVSDEFLLGCVSSGRLLSINIFLLPAGSEETQCIGHIDVVRHRPIGSQSVGLHYTKSLLSALSQTEM